MSEANTTQLELEKGFSQVSNDNDLSSPATVHKMKAETEDGGSEIESPTPEKRESRSKGVVVSSLARNLLAERYKDRFANHLVEDEGSLARNLLAERYKDRFANHLVEDEGETDDEDYNESVSPSGSRSLFSESIELLEK
jgi:chromatin licensing and DNA replication factor 1